MVRTIQFSCLFAIPAVVLTFLSGCSRPLADSIALSGQETKRALVGYDETTYVYPVRVPGSRQTVRIVTEKPLTYEPDYEDFLVWQSTGKAPEKDASSASDK